jgi:hypothetical protein
MLLAGDAFFKMRIALPTLGRLDPRQECQNSFSHDTLKPSDLKNVFWFVEVGSLVGY